MWSKHHIITINKTHSTNSTKICPTHIWTTYISKVNNNSKIKKSKAINMKYFVKSKEPILFLKFDEEMMKKMEDFCEWNKVSLWGRWIDKTMNNQKCLRENWKNFKNCPWSAKHAIFTTKPSREQVAKSSPQNPLWQNLKILSKCFLRLEVSPASQSRRESPNFLSKPRDWSFHSRTSCQTKSRQH